MNPAYSTEPRITITQPLFRNFGVLVNKADILIAKNTKIQSEKAFRNTVMDIISRTKIAYGNYIYYLKNYEISELSLKRLQSLLEINRARYEKGLVSSIDILEIEAQEAQREKALLSAEAQLKKAEDDLKLVTNLVDEPELWNAKIEIIDKPNFFPKEDLDLLKSLENAFNFRPDYQAAKVDLENRDIKIKVTKNALFPTLDLMGSLGLNGLGKDYQEAFSKTTFDYPDWSLGVSFSLPWGGAERAKYDQAKLEKTQALLSLKKLEQDIILEVRDKVREANIQYRQVEVSKISKDKETENYNAQKERYAAGQVSTHDMLDYHDKLSQAELDYIEALIDYNITLINLDKSQGLTLVKNNIKLEE
jgi:outer membrane protein TolC